MRPFLTARLVASGFFASSVVMRPLCRIRSSWEFMLIKDRGWKCNARALPQRGYALQPRVGAKRLPGDEDSPPFLVREQWRRLESPCAAQTELRDDRAPQLLESPRVHPDEPLSF